jgi:acyl transferase domain-containing protein/acyl-CoA synthetase (AMP-forming)/AMP-acid ligase II/NADPH:quinone reductase-like Zn-dependent oxidoreductase/acyl carrier protein/short-subunit dehydrogenase
MVTHGTTVPPDARRTPPRSGPSNSIDALLRWRAAIEPERTAYVFVDDHGAETAITYRALHDCALALAEQLRARGLTGQRVLLLSAQGLDFAVAFFGCLYARCVAVPTIAPRARRGNARLEAIIADCQPKLALCDEAQLQRGGDQALAAALRSVPWMSSRWSQKNVPDAVAQSPECESTHERPGHWREPGHRGDLALLQYTSGSTGAPKGVMVTQANLLANCAAIDEAFGRQPDDVGVSWLPLYHDMGLIGGVIQPLFIGCPSILMSPIAFVAQPSKWLQAISRHRATISGGPTFAYDLCVRKISHEQLCSLDLSSWRTAFVGADAIRADVLERFAEKFSSCGFRADALHPCYGLAESTLLVTGGVHPPTLLDSKAQRRLVGCGKPSARHHVAIVDPDTQQPLGSDQMGEIWVSGPSIAAGYWNRPQETAEVFQARLDGAPDRNYLRTGDLGLLHAGELFVTGRAKDLIIIRGMNCYPQDLEQTAERSHAALNPQGAAAFAIDTPEGEAAAVVAECARHATGEHDAAIAAIRAAISKEHEVSVKAIVLVRPGSVPRTSSGKIQRRACREAFLTNQLSGVLARWEKPAVHPPVETPASDPATTSPSGSNGNGSAVQHRGSTLLEQLAQRNLKAARRPDATPRVRDVDRPDAPREPLAIIGIGCRFPGAENLEAFRRLLIEGRDGVCEIPPERWDAATFFDPDPDAPGKMVTRWGGFLPDVDLFDAQLFGIAPREANRMDPQQRLLLEVAWHALEQAGLPPDRVAGSRTGVFVGIGGTDYSTLQLGFDNYLLGIDAYTGTGNAHSIAANRLSYLFDLHGPSLAVDTACSSSLVAMHLACQALRHGDCEMALVAGVNVILSPEVTLAFSKARMLSPDGRCYAFDDRANGYVRAEGCGVLVVKRLSAALADGDRVLAVVRGTAVNQDGRTSGITAPSGEAQQAVIRSALSDGGVDPDQLTYIEAHGTATPLGDPIEVAALRAVIGDRPSNPKPCYFGSVKANIGHLETASGVAGVIKVVLMLQEQQVFRQIHWKKLNRHISLGASPLRIPAQPRPWPTVEGHRIAGVNSFGFGGTNAHVVLEAPPSAGAAPSECPVDRPVHLLTVSAHRKDLLKEVAESYRQFLETNPQVSVADFCHAANVGRFQHAHRVAIVAESRQALCEQLQVLATDDVSSRRLIAGHARLQERRKIAFLFTGQGCQYAGMGRALYETQPTFRRVIDQCDELLSLHLPRSLLSVLYPAAETSSPIDDTLYAQPAIFAVECALGKLWEAWGVRPDAVMGHSIGEYAAAFLAGAFTLEAGALLVAERAQLMHSSPAGGAMAAVLADEAMVAEVLERGEFRDVVSIASVNGPKLVVVSGEAGAVDRLLHEFNAQGVASQRLNVSHAFHSFMMEGILDEFERAASRVTYRPTQLPLVSNLDGRVLPEGTCIDASYWRRHLRQSVQFHAGMESLGEFGCDVLLEIGPDSNLLSMGKKCLKPQGRVWAASLRKGRADWDALLQSLAELSVEGCAIDWRGFDQDYRRTFVALPAYPMARERFWSLPQDAATGAARGRGRQTGHPLLGTRVRTANQTQFETDIGLLNPSYLRDHVIHGSALVPAAAYLEMALAAAGQMWDSAAARVENVTFHQPLFLDGSGSHVVQLIVLPEVAGRAAFQIYSQPAHSPTTAWTMHVSGTLVKSAAEASDGAGASLDELRSSIAEELPRDELYRQLAARGLQYGPSFQCVAQVWRRAGEGLGRLQAPQAIEPQLSKHRLHPVLLDASFHVLAAAMSAADATVSDAEGYIPVGVDALRASGAPGIPVWAHARVPDQPAGDDDVLRGDVTLLDDEGRVIADVSGLRLKRLRRSAAEAQQRAWTELVYELRWKPLPPLSETDTRSPAELPGTWVVFADASGVGDELAATLAANGVAATLVRPGAVAQIQSDTVLRCPPDEAEAVWPLLEQLHGIEPRAWRIVHLWALDAATTDPIAQSLTCHSVVSLAQELARRTGAVHHNLWLATRGAQRVDRQEESVAVAQSLLWGLGRAMSRELPEIDMKLIDLDSRAEAAAAADQLLTELCQPGVENQIALRNGERFAPRLERAAHEMLEAAATRARQSSVEALVGGHRPFRLEVGSAGTIDALSLRPTERRPPDRDQVEIEVHSAGLNFSDVLKALGLYPGIKDAVVPLGIECAGRITAVGDDVDEWRIGDPVIALAPYAFGKYVVTPTYGVIRKPEHIGFEAAAAMSVAYITALYVLEHLARLQPGERVLIHAGAGGVGQAAIQIAQAAGAIVYSTAGTPEKREFLKSQRVEHVFDSRTLEFHDEILRITNGEGVDVVLNSLAGEAIPKSFSLLRAYGRFLEIGKIDIYQNRLLGLQPFQDNLSFFAIDMDRLFRQRPDVIRSLMAQLSERFERQVYQPLPFVEFPIADVAGAFRYMVQRKNIGKVVVSLRDDAQEGDREPGPVRSDRSYLITGGWGGLGLEVARWLVQRGVRHLALLGRGQSSPLAPREDSHRDGDSPKADISRSEMATLELRAAGVDVCILHADVADANQLAAALDELRRKLPPLAGVVHAAGVLDDGLLMDLTRQRFETVLSPKVAGAWNLHRATEHDQIDFTIYFSSIASVLGAQGQSNYSAANAFLDALAHERCRAGRYTLSVNWGPWEHAGMTQDSARRTSLLRRGLRLLNAEQALDILGDLIALKSPQAVVLDIDWPQALRLESDGPPPLVRDLVTADDAAAPTLVGDNPAPNLQSAAPGERKALLTGYFVQLLAKVSGQEAGRIDPDEPLSRLGLDSLMAMELKNAVESALQVSIPMATLFQDPSTTQLAEYVLVVWEASHGGAPTSVANAAVPVNSELVLEAAT